MKIDTALIVFVPVCVAIYLVTPPVEPLPAVVLIGSIAPPNRIEKRKAEELIEESEPTEPPCKYTHECWDLGECTPTVNGCIVASTADCLGSAICTRLGQCTKVGSECKATTQSECEKSHVCESHGRCSLVNGFCMATKEADCKEAIVACERMGECTLGHGHCIATRQKDCEESANCIDHGHCTLENERCIVKP